MLKKIYRFLNPKFQNLFLEYKTEFKPRYGHGKAPHSKLYSNIDKNRSSYQDFLEKSLNYGEEIWKIKPMDSNSKNPYWENDYFPGLDVVVLYTMLSEFKPKKYLEIGSGNSTKVVHKAKTEQNLKTEIISIDPFPRAEIDELADVVIREKLEDIDLSQILQLEAGDVLFIDNSHRILPNSDAMVVSMEILPFLKKGVIVHIHDVYLPYDYPQFMCDRFYSEQYGLGIALLENPNRYQVLMPNFFVSEDKGLAEKISPIWNHPNLKNVERHGGSFWMKIA